MKLDGVFVHVAVLTADLEKSIAFYQSIGGSLTDRGQAQKPTGVNHLALIDLYGAQIELIEPGDGTKVQADGDVIPHFAIRVPDVTQAAQALKEGGVDTFVTDQPNDLPGLFGGVRNWFLKGPSGELIELMQAL